MCGITGWVSFTRDLTREDTTIAAMTETMSCRGPDAAGVWSDRHAALGHRRLAVIDLPGGVQPMSVSTPNGEIVMVYSGEAYNFTELRDELIGKGERFITSSDTEVVLRGYLQWGEAVAERLNGMYAFAIWDARVRKLVMIRDRMGVKPFYFYRTPDGVLFGSEPKAILANPVAERVVDLDGLREMTVPVKTPRHAIWRGMSEVKPGTVVTVDERGIRENAYWRLESKLHTDDRETTVARVRELLDDIVHRQMIADVPQCVLLSGGLDSSTVSALASARRGDPIRTFSVDYVGSERLFKANDFNRDRDSPFAREMAKHVGSEHAEIMLNPGTMSDPEIRRKVVTARDIPIGHGDMEASMYMLFAAIREQSTVALSGESADEIFGGYAHFHDPKVQNANNFPWLVHETMGPIGSTTGSLLTPELQAAMDVNTYMQDRYSDAVAEVGRVVEEDDFTHRMRVINYLHLTRFVQILLDRKDRTSMAVGLEVRVPYCDHRLVEYVYNTPWALKTYDGREKSLLRGAVRDVLPVSILERVKNPYPSTQDPLYISAIQQQAKELLAPSDDGLFDLVDRSSLEQLTQLDPGSVRGVARNSLERALDLAVWMDIYHPTLDL